MTSIRYSRIEKTFDVLLFFDEIGGTAFGDFPFEKFHQRMASTSYASFPFSGPGGNNLKRSGVIITLPVKLTNTPLNFENASFIYNVVLRQANIEKRYVVGD